MGDFRGKYIVSNKNIGNKIGIEGVIIFLLLLTIILIKFIIPMNLNKSAPRYQTTSQIEKLIQKNASWETNSTWIFAPKDFKSTVLTGKSWEASHGKDYIYQNTYKDVSTYFISKDGVVSTPNDVEPLKSENKNSKKSHERQMQDLYSYSPLQLAKKYNLKFKVTSPLNLEAVGKCLPDLLSTKDCVDININIKLNKKFNVESIEYTGKKLDGSYDKITSIYSKYNETDLNFVIENNKLR